MKFKIPEIIAVGFFFILSLITFRPYILEHKVAINGNLLLAFFQPWASYKLDGYSVGPPAKPIGFDSLRIYYPTRKLVISSIKNGKAPLWNPYQFSGNVLLGTFQAAVFFPPGILFLLLPQVDAWSLIILLEPFLGSFFMYVFLNQIIEDKRASFFGALTFGFSAFMIIAWWEEMFMAGYTVILLPLLLYSIEKIFQKIKTSSFLVLLFAAVSSLTTGWFQMILYSWVFAFVWIVYKYMLTKNKKAMFATLMTFLLAGITSAIFLLPSVEAFIYSARSIADAKNDFTTYLMPWYHMVSYVAPDFFGSPAYHNYFGNGFYHETVLSIGMVGFIFALYALFSFDKTKSEKLFFKIAWIVSLSLGFSLPTSWFLLYYLKIPLLSTLLPSRIFFVSAFCASVLSAMGLQSYFKQVRKKPLVLSLIIPLVMLIAALCFALLIKRHAPIDFEREKVSIRNLILPGLFWIGTSIAIILSVIRKKLQTISFAIFIGITCVGSLYFTQKYLYFSSSNFIFPSVPVISELQKITGINRFLGVGDAYIDRNFAITYGLYSPEGYDSFNNQRYSELVYASHTQGKYSQKMPRDDILIMKSPNLQDTLSNPYRRRVISLLGVKYLVEKHSQQDYVTQSLINSNIKLIWSDNIFNIYENKEALPRIFFAYEYEVIHGNQKILDTLYDPSTNLSKKIILEHSISLSLGKNGDGMVTLLSYTPEKIIINTQSAINGLLMLTDSYYPGWKAYVDGKQVEILRADYSLRAIPLQAGTHTVIFSYQPNMFTIGVIISGFGVIFICITVYFLSSIKKI